MDFGSYVSGTTFGTKDLERQKDKKQAAREEEERLRFESKAFNRLQLKLDFACLLKMMKLFQARKMAFSRAEPTYEARKRRQSRSSSKTYASRGWWRCLA